MKYKVCVVTGTRADYGLLKELLFRLKGNTSVDLELVVTGSHLSQSFGNTQQEIYNDGFSVFKRIPIPINDDSKDGMAKSTGFALYKFAKYYKNCSPDIVILLGDRFEILAAAIAARMQGVPVAHISGGDVTEGAIDDSIRHAITKMSQIHFPGCEQSRKRIIQMGEQPDSVFNVGELGVENCLKTFFIGRKKLAEDLGFNGILKRYSVVTFHPVTMDDDTGINQVNELIHAMSCFDDMNYIITLANADAGGRAINNTWLKEMGRHSNWKVVASLGVQRYLSALKYSEAVIGNSSSGIVEAPSLGIPTVNIGDRQKGRMMAESIITCAPERKEIEFAIKKAISSDFQRKSRTVQSPFGDGNTSLLIEKHIMNYLCDNNKASMKKAFYDLPAHKE